MEEHCREIEILIEAAKKIQLSNAQESHQIETASLSSMRKDMRAQGITPEAIKVIVDYFTRMEKDFSYLTHPSKLPRAYEKALLEVSRRRKFRKMVDDECNRIKGAIHKEKEARQVFMNEYGRLLPSEFMPQLRDQTPQLKLEGGFKDYELPEINEGPDFFGSEFSSSSGASEDPGLRAKYNELLSEQSLLKEEHKSNIRELTLNVEALEL